MNKKFQKKKNKHQIYRNFSHLQLSPTRFQHRFSTISALERTNAHTCKYMKYLKGLAIPNEHQRNSRKLRLAIAYGYTDTGTHQPKSKCENFNKFIKIIFRIASTMQIVSSLFNELYDCNWHLIISCERFLIHMLRLHYTFNQVTYKESTHIRTFSFWYSI